MCIICTIHNFLTNVINFGVSGSFPGSLSGSETDVSTSNENLSHEERYVIQHTERQEPQGQENNRSGVDLSLIHI